MKDFSCWYMVLVLYGGKQCQVESCIKANQIDDHVVSRTRVRGGRAGLRLTRYIGTDVPKEIILFPNVHYIKQPLTDSQRHAQQTYDRTYQHNPNVAYHITSL